MGGKMTARKNKLEQYSAYTLIFFFSYVRQLWQYFVHPKKLAK